MSRKHIMFRVPVLSALAISLSLFASGGAPSATGAPKKAVPFATGGPDSFGYRYTDSQESTGPTFAATWEDISASGTQVFGPNTDDSVSGAINIGFSFPFYGTDYTSCYVSSNGNIHFTGPSATYPGTAIPGSGTPNAMIAGFWADCHTGPDGYIRYSSSSSRFIVQYISCEYYPSGNDQNFNYQIKILPSGTIFIAYETMSDTGTGSNTAIGIENASGTVGLQYCFNGSPNSIANNRVIRFANNSPPFDPTALTQAGDAGGTPRPVGYVSDSTIYFQATVTDPDSGNDLGIQAEVLPSTAPFTTNTSGTLVQTAAADMVQDGQVAEAALDFTTAGLPSGNYHWRARTIDANGATSGWVVYNAATVHFTTDFVGPTPPAGPLSPDGVQLIYLAPTGTVPFEWGPATDSGPPGPIAYRIEISLASGFGSTIYSSTISGLTADVNLTASDTPYYWRVSAVDQAGNVGTPTPTAIFQLSWTAPTAGTEDRHANCGATTSGGSPFTLALAGLAALLGVATRRRRATA